MKIKRVEIVPIRPFEGLVLSRYEVAIEKSLYKALAEWMKLQAMRQGMQLNPLFVEIGFVSQKNKDI